MQRVGKFTASVTDTEVRQTDSDNASAAVHRSMDDTFIDV